jgi:gamma-glutamylaminecyclotransferase
MAAPRSLIFVYGTLKRGGSNHAFIAGQEFVGEATTSPGFVLYELEGYPGMVADESAAISVRGELWSVDDFCLRELDALEGLDEGLYRRVPIRLAPPHGLADTYIYARDITGRRKIGSIWTV